MKTALTLLALSLAVGANALVLDTFTRPYSLTVNTGTWVDYQTDPEIYTGERDIALKILSETDGPAQLTIGGGRVTLTTARAERAFAYFEYDGIGDEVGNTGAGRVLNHNPRPDLHFPVGTKTVRFHIESFHGPGVFVVGARLYQNGVEMFSNSSNPTGSGPQIIDVDFTPHVFEICNTLEVRFSAPDRDSSLVISKIELVPEPSAGLVLGVGAAFFGARRLRKQRR